jgi:2-desacetyl-2-hydroxyethyl bacteriochlorophyllide A dehydrogenase
MNRQTVWFTAPERVEVREEIWPRPGLGQVAVRVLCTAISPGTELLVYRGQFPEDMAADETLSALAGALAYPLRYGYAALGEVLEVGPEVEPGWRGRRVFAFQPHASGFTARVDELLPVPDDVSAEDAVFLANMETAVNFVQDGAPLIGERVAVFGQGVVGLLTTAVLSRLPLDDLSVVDGFPQRREQALALGARRAFAPDEAGLLRDFDLVFECSGAPAALDPAIAAAGFAGRVVIGSWYGRKRVALDLGGRFHRDRIRLLSSQVSTLDPVLSGRWSKARRLALAWRMLAEVQPSRLVTHRLPLAQAPDAYALLASAPAEALQILLIP